MVLKKIFKVFFQIFTYLLLALLLVAIYGKIQMIVFKQNYVTYFGHTLFQVASASMEPELSIDDVIIVKAKSDFKVNDIVSFEKDGVIITHRVIDINDNNITVKGDANNTVDSPITKDMIIGKVVKVLPELGIWLKILTDPKILVAIFITLLFFDFAFSYKKKNNKVEEKPKEKKVIKEKILAKENPETEEILALTRQFDIEELNHILSKPKEEQKEDIIIKDITEQKKEDLELTSEYTIRLNLKDMQKQIQDKMK